MHTLFSHPYNWSKTYVAVSGVMRFSCVASAAHFFNLEDDLDVSIFPCVVSNCISAKHSEYLIMGNFKELSILKKLSRFLLALILLIIIITSMFLTTYAYYVGSANSNIYHYNNCEWAYRISSSNYITFPTVQDALSSGYRPCRVCYPPTYDRIIYKLRLDSPPQNMRVGDSSGFRWTYWPNGAIDDTITFTSSNPEVATIESGLVFAKSVGKTVITASTPNNVKYSYTLNVVKTSVEKIIIENAKSDFYINETYTLRCKAFPENATCKDMSYSSSNPDIVSIDDNGEIIAKKEGECKLVIECDGVKKEESVSVYYVKSKEIKTPLFFTALNNSQKPLNIQILPLNTSNKSYIAWSSDEKVAKINGEKIEAKKVGVATVYIKTVDGIEQTVLLVVHNAFVDIIVISLFAFLIFIIKINLRKRQNVKQVENSPEAIG